MERNCKGNQDRLSLLPDAILVEILSLLPLKSAVKTDTLSKRWRHLWTQITSVVVDDRIIYNSKLRDDGAHGVFTCLDNYIRGRVSPLIDIDTFVIDFQDVVTLVWKSPLFVSWLRPICRRNPRHLTVSLPTGDWYHKLQRVRWPPCIFKTRSLVSIQLRSNSPYYKSDEIELPYLKKLSIYVAPSQCRWLAKLVESCPLLEDLSLEFMFISNRAVSLKCTCLNLKRLSINLAGLKDKRCKRCKVVINAPKLEYLDASAAQSTNTTLCIGHEPVSLHEARLEFLDYTPCYNDEEGCDVEYFKNIFLSNVRILTLNLGVAVKTFTTFLYLTRLTLNIDFRCKFEVVTLFVELCPVLDVLTFRFKVTTMLDDTNWSNIPSIHALERVKKIEVLVCHNDFELKNRFAEVIGYLLNNALVLEHFCFSVIAPSFSEMGDAKLVTRKFARSEEELCDLLYNCPRASMDCEILFKGNFHSMSRNLSDICLRE